MGSVETETSANLSVKNRYERAKQRDERKMQLQTAEALLALQTSVANPDIDESVPVVNECGEKVQFFLKGTLEPAGETAEDKLFILEKMRSELQRLTTENMELKEKLKETVLTPESLENDEEKVKYYTGLTYPILMALFDYLSPCIPESAKSLLSKFEKLMIVLMKVRLNLGMQDLAYRFGVSISTVSKTFQDIIHIMFIRMKGLILWPEREELRLSMPMEFRKSFGLNVSIIIDCFEIFIERPSNLLARAETWSSYKHHNTVKYLIGITPQGGVSFLSKGWGGRVTDKHLTENCGLLAKLLPGDIVLADRGFDISESVGLSCAEVMIPAFTRGKKQLSPLEIEQTRKIAHTRIHVERVIGLVRNKYTILQSTIPIDYLHCNEDVTPTVDKMVTVCCVLSNLCPSVVPFD